jgi:hypothetical protein
MHDSCGPFSAQSSCFQDHVPLGLDRRQISPNDLGFRELICYINGPDSSSRADIEYPLWFVQRCHMEPSLEEHAVNVMHDVQSMYLCARELSFN